MMQVINSMGPDNKRALDIQAGVSTAVGSVAAIALGLGLGLGLGQGWERGLSLALSGGFLAGVMMAGAVSPFLPKKKEEDRLDDDRFVFIPDPPEPTVVQEDGPPPVTELAVASSVTELAVAPSPEMEKAPIVFEESVGREWFAEVVKHKDFPKELTGQKEVDSGSLKALFDYAHHFGQASPGHKMPYTEDAERLCLGACEAIQKIYPEIDFNCQTFALDAALEVARKRMADH